MKTQKVYFVSYVHQPQNNSADYGYGHASVTGSALLNWDTITEIENTLSKSMEGKNVIILNIVEIAE